MKKFFACYYQLIVLFNVILCCISVHAVTFTTNAWIADGNTTYDGQQLIVDACTLTIDGHHYFNSVYISNSAVITHSTGSSGVQLTVSNSCSVSSDSLIDVSARGSGPRSGTTERGGGSYGGRGGEYSGKSCDTYGDPFMPVDLGSGGPITIGGGKIHITAGTLELNGVLKANGEDAPEYAGSGSGGSIFIEAGTLTGNGMMQANGGVYANAASGGGGGRIAIYYDSVAGFNLNKIECAGENAGGSSRNGGAGTIFIKDNAETYGQLILDNLNRAYSSALPTDIIMITNKIDRLFVKNKARLALTLSNDLYLADTVLSGAYVTMTGNVAGPDLILTNGQWTHAGIFGFSNSVVLTDNSLLSHAVGYSNGLEIDAALVSIDTNSQINVTACGSGPRSGTTERGGGSYGGRGGEYSGKSCDTYGDPFMPVDLGSGGPITRGGGKIYITAGTFELNGVLKANGEDAPEYAGSGSGGSIFVEAGTLTGDGMMQASGGVYANAASGGGGGRIAIYYNSAAGFNLNNIECAGENAGGSSRNGGAGTIYIKNNAETYGQLILDNLNRAYSSALPTDIIMITNKIDRLSVKNQARFAMTLSNDLYLADTVLSGAYVTMTGNVAGPDLILTNGQWIHAGIFGFSNSVILTDNSMLSHVPGYSNGLEIDAALVSIDSNSQINVTACGSGPRSGTTGRSGGSYGGRGGEYIGNSCATYGDVFLPVDFGSGGPITLGGGKIHITAGTFELNGVLKANGEDAPEYAGSGSGGSIFIEAGTLTGNGMMQANGGVYANAASGGGGGRIAVYYDSAAGFNLNTIECAGANAGSSSRNGGAGTIYLKDNAETYGKLILNNMGIASSSSTPSDMEMILNKINRLYVCCNARLDLTLSNTLYLAETVISGGFVTVQGNVTGADIHLIDSTWTHAGAFDYNNSVILSGYSVLRHAVGYSNGLEITAAMVSIDTNSQIDVTACGSGPRPGTAGRSGGSYGGRGGNRLGVSCDTYGDPFMPVSLGSGGPITLGGGKIHITAGTFELNGVLKANGEDAPEYAGSGSGGSVFVEAGTLTGNGMMQANGGAKGRDGACGGGGRIAIYYDSAAGFNLNKIECAGENAGSSTYNGGAGTIYIKDNAETYGRMILDNMSLEYSSSRPTDFTMISNRFDRLFVNDKARLDLTLSNDLYLTDTVLSGAYVTMTGNVAGPDIILTNGQWTHAGIFGFSNAVILTDNSLLSHSIGYTNGLNIMAEIVYVETNSEINVSECGGTTRAGTTGRSGGSYGGRGENRSGESCPIYGDYFYPESLGSGGSDTRGGGKIHITATTLQLKGVLKANGENGPSYVGGGSGGAILVETVSLSGNGIIEANGGAEGTDAGAGGGGRIAIYYIEMTFPSTNITVNSGTGHSGTDGEGSLVLYGPRERFLVSMDSPYSMGENHHFKLRGGDPAPVGLRVQCLASETNGINAFAAPTTNRWNEIIPDGSDAYGYFVPYGCREDTVRMTRMGDELVLTNASDAGQPGFVASSVGFSISNRSSRGWLRAFSHTTITGAAFYADTVAPDTTLDWPGKINCAWQDVALVLSNINPAYVLQFTDTPYANISLIEGTVDCADDDDNKLPGSTVVVEYHLEGETVWSILDEELDSYGGFSGQVIADRYPTGVYVRACVKDTFSPRAGLPGSMSVGPIMVIPEPGLFLILNFGFLILYITKRVPRGCRGQMSNF